LLGKAFVFAKQHSNQAGFRMFIVSITCPFVAQLPFGCLSTKDRGISNHLPCWGNVLGLARLIYYLFSVI